LQGNRTIDLPQAYELGLFSVSAWLPVQEQLVHPVDLVIVDGGEDFRQG